MRRALPGTLFCNGFFRSPSNSGRQTMRARLALTQAVALMVLSICSLPDPASAQLPKRPGINRICGCFCKAGASISAPLYYTADFACPLLELATCNFEDESGLIRSGKLEWCEEVSQSYQPPVGPGRPPVGP